MVEDRFQKGALARVKQPDLKKVLTQEEQAQTRFRPSPYQPPCPAGIPPSIPPVPPPAGAPPGGEPSYTELIQRILEQNETMQQILSKMTELGTSFGTAPKVEREYYNTPQTAIQVATPNPAAGQPLDPDQITNGVNPGFQVETVYVQLGRKAPQISVINDGNASIYVITTPDGANWSPEAAILIGEARRFYNVWELRLRSTVAGTVSTLQGGVYRVTEYEYSLAYTSTVTFNRTAFDARVVNAPVQLPGLPGGALLPNITVPNGFALVVRANINNAVGEQIFVANSIANAGTAGVPGNRVTLNSGDRVALYVTNANLIAVASTTGLGNADILVEQ